jgi:hypothetical protein
MIINAADLESDTTQGFYSPTEVAIKLAADITADHREPAFCANDNVKEVIGI